MRIPYDSNRYNFRYPWTVTANVTQDIIDVMLSHRFVAWSDSDVIAT
jgi:hypothetical protein